MAQAGVICEYNPFHDGHLRQLQWIRAQLGADTPIVCVMSGDYVQRGEPAVFSKAVRARAAVLCGASLVAELPLPAALSSAEGFARGGVAALDALGCDTLCFGSECGDAAALQAAAQVLLRPDFGPALRRELAAGVSFAAARELAAASLGADGALLRRPNDILAVEYCKALQTLGSPMAPVTLRRDGDYHAAAPSAGQPSATALRGLLASGAPLTGYVPLAAEAAYAGARRHWLRCGERAVLARLRTMDDGAFRALPFGSEGLWHRLAAACRRETSVEAIVRAVNKFNDQDNATYKALMRATIGEALGLNSDPEEVDLLERKIEALNNKMLALVNESVISGEGIEAHESEFMSLSQEVELLKQRIAAMQESAATDSGEQERLEQIQAIIAEREDNRTEYDDSIVRQMIECIKVYPGGKLEIIFGGGYLVEETV